VRALRIASGTRARLIWLGSAGAAGLLGLAVYLAPGPSLDQVFAQDVAYFRIGAGAPGSTLYDLAGRIAGAISNPPGSRQCDNDGPCGVEGLIGLAQTTTDPADGLQSLESGSLESVIVSADIADAAAHGTGPFKKSGAIGDLRAIANVGQLVLHVLVAKEERLPDIGALNGKRIAIGVKDSENAITARFLLRAAGLNEKKTKLVTGELDAAAQDVLDAKVDAVVLVAQLPSADVAALMATGNYQLLAAQVTGDNASAYVTADWIPHRQYAGAEATPTVSLPAVWVVRAGLPDSLAGGLAQALWRSAARQEDARGPGRIRLEMDQVSVPLHPGAQAAFAELRKADAGPAPQPEATTTN
jgi:uncharacterized protein